MHNKMISVLFTALIAGTFDVMAGTSESAFDTSAFSYSLDLKTPGNPATHHQLTAVNTGDGKQTLTAAESLPVAIFRRRYGWR